MGTLRISKKAGIPATTGIPASTTADYRGNFGLEKDLAATQKRLEAAEKARAAAIAAVEKAATRGATSRKPQR